MNQVLLEWQIRSEQTIRVLQGDITEEPVEAIVNAANERLAHGGGVAGAIVRKGGWEIQEESNAWVLEHGRVSTGSVAITTAGQLLADYVIHAVGPVWGSGDEDAKLASAVRSSLQLAAERSIRSISFPAISAGIFGFPEDRCARILLHTIVSFLREHPDNSIREVHVCLYGAGTAEVFMQEARRWFDS
jgi:O-acetyl-ADP-ribose deacetylase (regulator of RNase III)